MLFLYSKSIQSLAIELLDYYTYHHISITLVSYNITYVLRQLFFEDHAQLNCIETLFLRIHYLCPLFQAAVSTLIQGEGGQQTAVRLLPAYVNRGTLECTIALKALEKFTLAEAFAYLIEHLDRRWTNTQPPSDFYK